MSRELLAMTKGGVRLRPVLVKFECEKILQNTVTWVFF